MLEKRLMKNYNLCLLLSLVLLVSACAPSNPAATDALTGVSPSQAPESSENMYGVIEFPYLHADAGNFQLQTGETITFTWKDAPADAERYDFMLYPLDGSQPIVLGIDTNVSDGAAIEWLVLPNLSGELRGLAYYPDGSVLRSGISGTIYS
jgi:hypothetical protein